MIKVGARRCAAEYGIALIAPDTSEVPWATHYRMESYIRRRTAHAGAGHLADRGCAAFVGIFGHSMGGHGALRLGEKALTGGDLGEDRERRKE